MTRFNILKISAECGTIMEGVHKVSRMHLCAPTKR